MPLFDHVADFFRAQALTGTAGVVAVSGGPDSVALARAAWECVERGLLTNVVLGHVNHRLRGGDSDRDESFVKRLPTAWGGDPRLTWAVELCEPAGAEPRARRGNLEATLRHLRYDALGRIARRTGAHWVATGHTADDQAETVLFRFLRGSGLQGLAAIRPRRPFADGLDLVRPLLAVTRDDLLAFLTKWNQEFCEDATNRDPRFTRNRLRHELLPLLKRDYNPAVSAALARLARQSAELHDDLTAMAATLLRVGELPRAGRTVVLDPAVLGPAPASVCREALQLLWQREGWPLAEMDHDHWQALRAVVRGERTAWDFPGRVRARHVGRVVQVGHAL